MKTNTSCYLLTLAAAGLLGILTAAAETSVNVSNRWAWGESTGWINCRPDNTNGAVIGEFFCSGYFWSPATGWIDLGNGDPTNGYAYCNNTVVDFGVNHDRAGNLRGYAWSAAIGWLAFEDIGAPKLDLESGVITGHAWSESMGWISFSNLQYYLSTDRLDEGPDRDMDGMPDAWEIIRAGTTGVLHKLGDYDHDHVLDPDEYMADTCPTSQTECLTAAEIIPVSADLAAVRWMANNRRWYQAQAVPGGVDGVPWEDLSGPRYVAACMPMEQMISINVLTSRWTRVKASRPLSFPGR